MLMMESIFEQRIAVVFEDVLKQHIMMMCKREVELEQNQKKMSKSDFDRSAN